jgi:hypothetical protein
MFQPRAPPPITPASITRKQRGWTHDGREWFGCVSVGSGHRGTKMQEVTSEKGELGVGRAGRG